MSEKTYEIDGKKYRKQPLSCLPSDCFAMFPVKENSMPEIKSGYAIKLNGEGWHFVRYVRDGTVYHWRVFCAAPIRGESSMSEIQEIRDLLGETIWTRDA